MKILIFYVPCADRESASAMVNDLLNKKLIACGNIIESGSLYKWENELCSETEFVVVMKTGINKEKALEEGIEELHTYDVPCIARWTIEVNESYGNWVEEEVAA